MMKLTFDGHGLNNASDEYKGRVATFYAEYKNIKGFGDKIARAYNCHDDLLTALEGMIKYFCEADLMDDYSDTETVKNARAAIAKAEGNL